MGHARPNPTRSKLGKIEKLCRRWFFVFVLTAPFLATPFEDALQELFAGFVAAIFFPCEFGFGGDETTFASRFYHTGAVAFQCCLIPSMCLYSVLLLIKLFLN